MRISILKVTQEEIQRQHLRQSVDYINHEIFKKVVGNNFHSILHCDISATNSNIIYISAQEDYKYGNNLFHKIIAPYKFIDFAEVDVKKNEIKLFKMPKREENLKMIPFAFKTIFEEVERFNNKEYRGEVWIVGDEITEVREEK